MKEITTNSASMERKKFLLWQNNVQGIFLYMRQKKYEFLLFSFMLLIFGNTFSNHHRLIGIGDIYQNLVMGLIVFYDKKIVRYFILAIILISVALDVYELHFAFVNFKSWHNLLYLAFFTLVSKEVYKEVLYVKTVSGEMLAAALCGFVLLCLIATFLFFIVETEIPHSFSNIGEPREAMSNLNYFSFTTLLTIGYGDITPLSIIAKRAVMLIGLAGHFYTVFITSIIIGKYLSAKQP